MSACPTWQAPAFGTAGLPVSFAQQGYRKMWQVPEYLQEFGLTAFEYQCGRGVRLNPDTARRMRTSAVAYSVHAPYYISMAGMEQEKRQASLRYLLESAAAVKMLGGNRVVFHAGGCGKQSRAAALAKVREMLACARALLDVEGYGDIHLCPETMGKASQLGSLDEVLAWCKADRRHIPCLDFGHLNARTQGGIAAPQRYADILDAVGDMLGDARAVYFHVHFSKIEYSAGGERRHLTFADTQYGPDPAWLMELCAVRKLAPVIICESDGTQAEDAREMMRLYNEYI